MNKRSAMLVAAGLILTLIAGGVAVMVGATGPQTSAAALRSTKLKTPIVRTIQETVKVHKKGQARTVSVPVSAASGVSSSGSGSGSAGGSDDGFGSGGNDDSNAEPDDDGDEDHADEGEDHEDDDA